MLEEIRKADGLIIGSPNYLGDVSAAFRSLYERLIFQYITYNTEAQSYNDHRIPVLLIMTSNTPDDSNIELMNKYKAVFDSFVGPTEILAVTMVGSMYGGAILSKHALSFLPIKGGRAFAREVHTVSAYCGFVLISLHLGLHWSMMMGMARRFVKELPTAGRWMLRGIAAFIAGYGVYAFIRREIGHYMFLQNQYVFFDFEEPLIFFLADYMAVMALFVWVSHYFSKGLRYIIQKRKTI